MIGTGADFVLWSGPTPERLQPAIAREESGYRYLGEFDGQPLHAGLDRVSARRGCAWIEFSPSRLSLLVGSGRIGLDATSMRPEAVLVEGLEAEGLDFLQQCNGDFAFAFVRLDRQEILCARDALGIRALYQCRTEAGGHAVSSHVRAFSDLGLLPFSLDAAGVASFLQFGSVYAPASIAAGARALPAGGWSRSLREEIREKGSWWEPPHSDPSLDAHDGAEQIRAKLEASVARHSATAEDGCTFASGGMDSSALLLLQSELGVEPLRTLSLAFAGDSEDVSEHPYQQQIAEFVHSQHHEVTIEPDQLPDELEHYFAAMDQPTIDGFNTFVVARGAERYGWTNSISGFGGDELFAGYDDFHRLDRHRGTLARLAHVPAPARKLASGLLAPTARLTRSVRLAKLGHIAGEVDNLDSYYVLVRSLFLPDQIRRLTGDAPGLDASQLTAPSSPDADLLDRWGALELRNHLPNMLLRSCDQFRCGGEIRLPFLDRRVAEAVLRVPVQYKVRPGEQKPLMQQALRGRMPDFTWKQRKRHFHVPLERWLQQSLDAAPNLAGTLDENEVARIALGYRRKPAVRRYTRAWALEVLGRYLAGRRAAGTASLRAA